MPLDHAGSNKIQFCPLSPTVVDNIYIYDVCVYTSMVYPCIHLWFIHVYIYGVCVYTSMVYPCIYLLCMRKYMYGVCLNTNSNISIYAFMLVN